MSTTIEQQLADAQRDCAIRRTEALGPDAVSYEGSTTDWGDHGLWGGQVEALAWGTDADGEGLAWGTDAAGAGERPQS